MITLRPVIEKDLDTFEESFSSLEGASEFQWFGFTPMHGTREQLSARGLLRGDSNVLAVCDNGALVGRVDWFERRWGRPDTSTCLEIAVGILPEKRNQGIGYHAQQLLVSYLFEHTRVERIQATTDPLNVREIACLRKIGFTQEGVVRRAQWRGGRWHDQLLFSLLRGEATELIP